MRIGALNSCGTGFKLILKRNYLILESRELFL